jgi:hypothetical protein
VLKNAMSISIYECSAGVMRNSAGTTRAALAWHSADQQAPVNKLCFTSANKKSGNRKGMRQIRGLRITDSIQEPGV